MDGLGDEAGHTLIMIQNAWYQSHACNLGDEGRPMLLQYFLT